jgi:hypothetical protein
MRGGRPPDVDSARAPVYPPTIMIRATLLLACAAAVLLGCGQSSGERKVLGGLDLDAYCRSTGKVKSLWRQTPIQFEGKKTWGCEAKDGSWAPLSTGVACTAQYKTTAHGEQERGDDPTSWLCVAGPGPSTPPAHWNRANM